MSGCVAIVQARMGSTRLPGKVLADLAGEPMLRRVLQRTQRARRLDGVVVATTVSPQDDAVATAVTAWGIPVIRGSEEDVLDRYRQAAAAVDAEAVVRITADCPLIDPDLIDQVVAAFQTAPPVDFAANTLERTYPQGLDVEMVGRDVLETAWREAVRPYERAHVMPFVYERPDRFRLRSVSGPGQEAQWRWTVDTPADLILVRALYDRLGRDDFTWTEALALVRSDPALQTMNAHVRQKARHEG